MDKKDISEEDATRNVGWLFEKNLFCAKCKTKIHVRVKDGETLYSCKNKKCGPKKILEIKTNWSIWALDVNKINRGLM